jgi:hypothetical protein
VQPACPSPAPRPWQTTGTFPSGRCSRCTSSSRERTSIASWSASCSCWFESVFESVGSDDGELNELCVPIHAPSRSGSRFPRRYWNASARCSQVPRCPRAISRLTCAPSGAPHASSGMPLRRHCALAASASFARPVHTKATGLSSVHALPASSCARAGAAAASTASVTRSAAVGTRTASHDGRSPSRGVPVSAIASDRHARAARGALQPPRAAADEACGPGGAARRRVRILTDCH